MNSAHLLQFLPFSRKPLAKGLAAIFSCVIWGHTSRVKALTARAEPTPPSPPHPHTPPKAVTHPRVLVGCHRDECRLGEAEGGDTPPVLAAELGGPHQVDAGLVLVHGVQDQLGEKERGDAPPAQGDAPPAQGGPHTHPSTCPPRQLGPHMAVGVQGAVGELDPMERHRLPHPVGTRGGRVGVNVDAVRQAGLRLAAGLPAPALPAVASPVHGNHIQKKQVAGLGVQASD